MEIPQLPKLTHSRTGIVIYGMACILTGLFFFAVPTLVGSPHYTVSILGYGCGIAVVLFGVLLTMATPTTGDIKWKIRIYKLQLAVATVIPIAATVPVLRTRYQASAIISVIPIAVLYLALQIDWHEARRHLQKVRDADNPDDVQWIPPQALTYTRHVMYGGGAVLFGFVILTLITLPPLAEVLVGLAFLVAGIAVILATPHRGTIDRTVLGLKMLVLGPGFCFLLAGLVTIAAAGSAILATITLAIGGVLIYYGLVMANWSKTGPVLREMRTADEVTWALAEEAEETVLSRRAENDGKG